MDKLKEISLYVLGTLISLGFFALLYLLIYTAIPEQNKDVLNLVIGALIGSFSTVVGYFFGSSKSSSDKNKLINNK